MAAMTMNAHLDEPDGWEGHRFDDLRIDFAFDHHENRLAYITTVGLWQFGLPELFLRPPQDLDAGDASAAARRAVFFATALIHLGDALMVAEDFDVSPYRADLDGRPVQFWLGDKQPPLEPLALMLGPEVDTVIRVECSLWHPPLLGDG